ncbi:MAG: hypothetical protein FJX74_25260, partial [Armatimonadetes bacterium]|nr:hypothetical protein [Armatimonadota bacterium]
MMWGGLALCLGACCSSAQPPAPTPPELAERRRWVAAKFEGDSADPTVPVGLEVRANHGPVQADSRGGQPLQLAGTAYARGLYCHAPSRVIVRLAEPGARFEALAGVDSNDQTSGGR